MSRTIIGIDPGKSGGLALLHGEEVIDTEKLDGMTEGDLAILIDKWNCEHYRCYAFMEKVNAGPKMASSAAFKFGRNVGMLHMAFVFAGVRLEFITPQKWQKELGLIVKGRGLGQDDTAKKNRNKARAQELFPGIKITHAIADALLIAEYGRRATLTEQ